MPIKRRKTANRGKTKPRRKTKTRRTKFGALTVPSGMRPVSTFRRTNNPFLIMPFGPPGRWLESGPQGAASSSAYGRRNLFGSGRIGGVAPNLNEILNQRLQRTRFGSLAGSHVNPSHLNPSGYLSTWYGQPRIVPPSWNPLLFQGDNAFREGINSPLLSNVVANSGAYANSFGRFHPITPRTMPSHHLSFGKNVKLNLLVKLKLNLLVEKSWLKEKRK